MQFLRANGFAVGVSEGLDALVVAQHCELMDRQRLGWGLRSLLCSNADQWSRFDSLFQAYWNPPNRQAFVQSSASARVEKALGQQRGSLGQGETIDVDGSSEEDDGEVGDGGSRGGASLQASRSQTDFRFLHDGREMRELEELAERLARRMRRRLIRRQRVQQHGRRIHLRRTLRKSLRYGGTPLELAFKNRRRLLPRLVLILDVSRSMNLYSYFFLRFARGIVEAFRDAHAFVLHTRLVHITDALRERDMTKLKEKLAILSMGWGGGTRIGDCLGTFNREYGRLVHSRSVVVVVSDGLDTGEPEVLADGMARLRQRARRILWLNPLLGRDGYEPAAGGMQAALPYLDLFAPAHNLDSLQALETHITNV
ncbi:MAG: VWA domain-containing protein [Gammaproteobacteria bacterium]|nr:VWA domain-containing protein [Gammaproteobacteria bacterium]MDJ0871347.1 VWA domain-containing protein [Gammaproteobacteria bacterium]MDJ0889986.1 VWA domain-containing protein [Gammaproteobacteria bacterium]